MCFIFAVLALNIAYRDHEVSEMIGKYKIIALCTCRIQDGECHELVNELDKQLNKMDCRLFVYNCVSKPNTNTDKNAQTSVFDLIDPSFCDAVVIHSYRFDNSGYCESLSQHFRDMGLPCISLGEHISGCLNLEYRHKDGFAEIVSHLVKYHGYKDIHMIAGVKGNPYSNERIEAFREVLQDNNIPFDDSMVSYGDFWSVPAVAAAEKLLKENRLPQAIVCANDHMAVAVSYFLQGQGISVPGDVAVAGYDGIETIYSAEPAVSSAGIFPSAIAKAVCETINRIFVQGAFEENIPIVPEPIINESCGCTCEKKELKFNASAPYNELINKFYRFQDENVILSDVSERIQQCDNFEDVAAEMRKDDLMYAMTCVIKRECTDSSVNPEDEIQMHFGDKLFVLYDSDDWDKKRNNGEKFIPYDMNGRDIIPNLNEYLSNGRCFIFTALGYLGVPLGYTCFHFSSYIPSNYYKIPQTVNMLNNALGGLRSLRHQHYLLNRVDEISRTDALTGLCNRHGFCIEYEHILRGLGEKSLAVIMCDLDELKTINDKFGHDNGDYAIKNAAQALKKVCPPGAACTRFGGDEMMAVFPCCGAENDIRPMFYKALDNINEVSGKPYKVAASMGIYITQKDERPSFDELIRFSDKLMYEEKTRRKAARI